MGATGKRDAKAGATAPRDPSIILVDWPRGRRDRHRSAVSTSRYNSAATVRRVLAKVSLSRLSHRKQAQQVLRYVREHRGGLIRLDIKPLLRFKTVSHRLSGSHKGHSKRRGAGWGYLQV